MKTPTSKTCIVTLFTLLALGSNLLCATPLGTAFTYQGRLASGTNAANGSFDLKFSLYDGTTKTLIVNPPAGNRYYRLTK